MQDMMSYGHQLKYNEQFAAAVLWSIMVNDVIQKCSSATATHPVINNVQSTCKYIVACFVHP